MTVSEIIEKLGGTGAVADRYRVTANAVSNWRVANAFPRRLHMAIWLDCRAAGVDLPPSAIVEPPASASETQAAE